MKRAGDSHGDNSHSPDLQAQLGQSSPSSSGLEQARRLRVKQPTGKGKLGSESRHASLRVL